MNLRRALAALTLCASCDVFDPTLYQSSGALTLAERCEDLSTVPRLTPRTEQLLLIDTTSLGDQYREFTSCVGRDLPGNEGFFSAQMRRGETWHFHVDPLDPTSDPAVYVLPTCTTLQCSAAAAADACGAGRGEHFSFRPVTDGTHLVGIDSRARGGARYTVTAVNAVCGDGIIQHGEPCDDMRPQSGVRCERCQKVLDAPMASESGVANDDYTNAIALRPTGGLRAFPVVGSLGGCDQDMFQLALAAGERLTVTLTPRSGTCPAGLNLTLRRSDTPGAGALTAAPSTVSEATVAQTDLCPTLTLARAASAGEYFVGVSATTEPTGEFSYQLTFDVAP
ncbi:MAG: hypothetical protein U0325_30975 [Polyangiales bacterium]